MVVRKPAQKDQGIWLDTDIGGRAISWILDVGLGRLAITSLQKLTQQKRFGDWTFPKDIHSRAANAFTRDLWERINLKLPKPTNGRDLAWRISRLDFVKCLYRVSSIFRSPKGMKLLHRLLETTRKRWILNRYKVTLVHQLPWKTYANFLLMRTKFKSYNFGYSSLKHAQGFVSVTSHAKIETIYFPKKII